MEKLSPVGCYFLLSNEPSVGSVVEMEIHIPAELTGKPVGTLLCKGTVVDLKKTKGDAHTGVTCRIEQYELIPEAADFGLPEENP